MRTVRWVVVGGALVALGAAAGFAVSLLKPRSYADFSAAKPS